MARISQLFDEKRPGSLVVEELSAHCVEVFYHPSQESLALSGMNPDRKARHRVKLLKIDGLNQCITIFPIKARDGRDDFLQPKYKQIRSITLGDANLVFFPEDSEVPSDSDGAFLSPYFGPTMPMEKGQEDIESLKVVPSTQEDVMKVLEGLPPAFTKDYDHGLGLAQPYRFIVNAVEKLSDCTEIVISELATGINQEEKIFYISFDDFEMARKTLNNITNLSRKAAESVKEGEVYNFFHSTRQNLNRVKI